MALEGSARSICETLAFLKRKRATSRGKLTKFINSMSSVVTSADEKSDIDYFCDRLTETVGDLKELDDKIHDLLSDTEYETDVVKCEEYIESAKRAIHKAKCKFASAVASFDHSANIMQSTSEHSQSVKLPTVKLEAFRGDVENWQRFWEQFVSAIDSNRQLSTIDKHVFLRGFLEDEPKRFVDGIAISSETYDTVKEMLQTRYGDKNRIIQAHLDFLEGIKPLRNPDPDSLNNLYIECNRRLQALKALGENTEAYGRILSPKILRAFPHDIVKRWIIFAKREKILDSDITRLMTFLSEEVEGSMISLRIQSDTPSESCDISLPTTAAFQVNSKSNLQVKNYKPFCVFCERKGHWAQECKVVVDINDRIEKLKSSNRCFLCTNRGHRQKFCPRKNRVSCAFCKRKHHVSICTEKQKPISANVGKVQITQSYSYLQTACIFIYGPTGLRKKTRCIFDSGSQCTFIQSTLVDQLDLSVSDSVDLAVHTFESTTASRSQRKLVRFELSSIWNKHRIPITAFESENIHVSQPTTPDDIIKYAQIHGLKLADSKEESDKEIPIELLIGIDYYWKIIGVKPPIRLSESLVLLPSMIGWILSGGSEETNPKFTYVQNVVQKKTVFALEDQVREFWDLEAIGIKEHQNKELNSREIKIMDEFRNSYKMEDGRRVVKLLWKEDAYLNLNNYSVAMRRLKLLQKKLELDHSLRENYLKCMQDYIDKNQVEIAPLTVEDETKLNYLPHHAVKKVKDGQLKWRIVFDASSHQINSPSLNDVLDTGPNLLPEIFAALLRFRLHKMAFTSDGSQAFLQLVLHESDRDATRFLWFATKKQTSEVILLTDEVITYRFKRLPFGLTCSPFLLSAVLRETANINAHLYPNASHQLDKNLFMDDFLMGSETDEGILNLYNELKLLTSHIKLPLAKWASNSATLQSLWREEGTSSSVISGVLGMNWNTQTDTFQIDIGKPIDLLLANPCTKRNLLKAISTFYDPMGLLTPVTVTGKIIFQETWLRGIGWEEILPPDISHRLNFWREKLLGLSQVEFPRWIGLSTNSDYSIHVFCDSSELAYGAALYIRVSHDKNSVTLVCSKSRLVPVKKVTLPRLELLAALLGARVLEYFCRETQLNITGATLWSDSSVTLCWIRSNPSKWKTFVCNRVTEILKYTSPAQWRYCPSSVNPADNLSRGVSPEVFIELKSWFKGPDFLSNSEEAWPIDVTISSIPSLAKNEIRQKSAQILQISEVQPLINIKRFSSYIKLIRTVGWIFRFIEHCKLKVENNAELTCAELEKSKNFLICITQKQCFPNEIEALKQNVPLPTKSCIARFNPFLDDGILRLGGRLHKASLSYMEKHPVILDGSHHFVQLLISYTHIRMHHLGVRIVLSELRSEFWIIGARRFIKKALFNCLPCKLSKLACCKQVEAPLPEERVSPSKAFDTTGIDFAGPLFVRNEYKKAYITLFTCASTRALHLELVSDLSTDKFLLALQRFTGRRGLPRVIYTDNAATFKAAHKELACLWVSLSSTTVQRFFAESNIIWKFIAPRAAWWGGWWERLIGVTKACLRKSLGRALLDAESLSTVLIAIEAALNSRPLTYEFGSDDMESVLTPSHFLIGQKLNTIPSGPESRDVKLVRLFRRQQEVADHFWRRWTREYLLHLRNYHEVKNVNKIPNVREGDIVLVHEDVRPRHMWKKARVVKLLCGRDGKVRSCHLKTPGGLITRPLQLIIPLEVDQGGEDVAD